MAQRKLAEFVNAGISGWQHLSGPIRGGLIGLGSGLVIAALPTGLPVAGVILGATVTGWIAGEDLPPPIDDRPSAKPPAAPKGPKV